MHWFDRPRTKARNPVGLASNPAALTYDLSEFEKIDPQWRQYRPASQFETGFSRPRHLVAMPAGRIIVSGDGLLRFFDVSGHREQELRLQRSASALRWLDPQELFIGLGDRFEVRDLGGSKIMSSESLGSNSFVTSAVAQGSRLYIADAGKREIAICDRSTGAVIGTFGRDQSSAKTKDANPGFVVPSPYFDLSMDSSQRLIVANPGRLRVESYTLDGRFLSSWGQAGMGVEQFSGCCNPVHIALMRNGDLLTSEKGLNRIKVYGSGGQLKAVVAGPRDFDLDQRLARKACADCSVGAGFDVAEGVNGRVFVLDPYYSRVRQFERVETS